MKRPELTRIRPFLPILTLLISLMTQAGVMPAAASGSSTPTSSSVSGFKDTFPPVVEEQHLDPQVFDFMTGFMDRFGKDFVPEKHPGESIEYVFNEDKDENSAKVVYIVNTLLGDVTVTAFFSKDFEKNKDAIVELMMEATSPVNNYYGAEEDKVRKSMKAAMDQVTGTRLSSTKEISFDRTKVTITARKISDYLNVYINNTVKVKDMMGIEQLLEESRRLLGEPYFTQYVTTSSNDDITIAYTAQSIVEKDTEGFHGNLKAYIIADEYEEHLDRVFSLVPDMTDKEKKKLIEDTLDFLKNNDFNARGSLIRDDDIAVIVSHGGGVRQIVVDIRFATDFSYRRLDRQKYRIPKNNF